MIEEIEPESNYWSELIEYLEKSEEKQWVIDENNRAFENVRFMAAVENGQIIGCITIKKQDMICPATEFSGGQEFPISNPDGKPLHETFVQTFSVQEAYRRQGYGRQLQQAALELTRRLGCYQMRSWSSIDRPANFALKISMGFAVHPAKFELPDGRQISGAYFVMHVSRSA